MGADGKGEARSKTPTQIETSLHEAEEDSTDSSYRVGLLCVGYGRQWWCGFGAPQTLHVLKHVF